MDQNRVIENGIPIDEEILAHVVEIRRYLHRHPEPSWHEFNTTAYLKKRMTQIEGIEWIDLGCETGGAALLKGASAEGEASKRVALRADIDALHADEAYESPCKSEIPGVAHLCGHDFHAAVLCGAAEALAKSRERLSGQVLFIFQPAEETTNGAQMLINHGLYEKYPFDAVFGLHNRPELETGHVIVKLGGLMAAKINFRIVVHGVGGHGSMPHKCVDPIVCAAGMVQNVLTISSRNTDPMEAIVLSICSIHGGTPDNLIVDTVEMTGSMRYLDQETGKRALARLKTVVEGTALTFGCHADFEIVESINAVENSPKLYDIAKQAAVDTVSINGVESSQGCLATEDFSEYMKYAPGMFYWLGNRKPNDEICSWHNARFHVDEDALVYGVRLLANSAYRFLTSAFA